MPEIIQTKLISQNYHNLLACYFDINKTRKFINQKHYWLSFKKNAEVYVKDHNVYLALKTVKHKPYDDFQLLSIPTYCWKDFSIDFITGLPISTNQKDKSYNSILIIINQFPKMIYYELVKITINAPRLAKVLFKIVVWHYNYPIQSFLIEAPFLS